MIESLDFIWSISVIQKILTDERYVGTYVAGKTRKQIFVNLHRLIENAFRENALSHELIDVLVDTTYVYPGNPVEIMWKLKLDD